MVNIDEIPTKNFLDNITQIEVQRNELMATLESSKKELDIQKGRIELELRGDPKRPDMPSLIDEFNLEIDNECYRRFPVKMLGSKLQSKYFELNTNLNRLNMVYQKIIAQAMFLVDSSIQVLKDNEQEYEYDQMDAHEIKEFAEQIKSRINQLNDQFRKHPEDAESIEKKRIQVYSIIKNPEKKVLSRYLVNELCMDYKKQTEYKI